MAFILPLLSAALPLFLWPVEVLLPYPHVVEEVAKLFVVLLILRAGVPDSTKIKLALISAVLFSLSESVLYLFNIFLVGNIQTFFQRLALTIPLHSATFLIILLSALKRRPFIFLGLLLAIAIHYVYNNFLLLKILY